MSEPTPELPVEQPQGAPEAPEQQPAQDVDSLPDWARERLTKANKEAASYRTKVRELEPLARRAQEIEDANKSEVQRATERAQQLEQELNTTRRNAERFQLAAKYGIGEDHFRYIVGDTPEEREEAAVGIAQMLTAVKGNPAPRGDRPVESLRPGATPTEQLSNEEVEYARYFPQG